MPAFVVKLAGHVELVGRHGPGPPAGTAAGAGGLQAGGGPLADEGGLELGQGAEDVEDKQPGRGSGVDALGQGPEPHLAGPQVGHGRDQVAQVPAEPIEAPYDEGVTRAEVVEDLVELGAVVEGAAGLVGPDPDAAGGLEGVGLEMSLLLDLLTRA